MSTIVAGTDWVNQPYVLADLIDQDVDNIRAVIDADGGSVGFGIDNVNLNASANLRLDQTAEPAARMLINVPLPDITGSTTEQAPFSLRVYTVCPVAARLARASVAWRTVTVSAGNSYISIIAAVMGYQLHPAGTSFGLPGSGGATPSASGLQTILQATNDLKFMQFINRPAVAAYQPIPIDVSFDFDGSSFTLQGFRIQLELNVEHQR